MKKLSMKSVTGLVLASSVAVFSAYNVATNLGYELHSQKVNSKEMFNYTKKIANITDSTNEKVKTPVVAKDETNKVEKKSEVATKEAETAEKKAEVAKEEVKKTEEAKKVADKEAKEATEAVEKAEQAKKVAEEAMEKATTEEEKKLAEEQIKAAEEEARKAAEVKKEAEEARLKAEQAQKEAEEQARRAEEEAAKAKEAKEKADREAEEARLKAEEEAKKAEEAQKEAEETVKITEKSNKATTNNETKANEDSTEKKSSGVLTEEILKKAAEGEKRDRENYEKALREKGITPPSGEHSVEFHFYSTLRELRVRRNGDAEHWAECGVNGVNCIWFVEFSCDMNECEGFAEPGSNELSGRVLIGRRGDTTEYIMQPPKAKPGYRFKAWEIVSARGTVTEYGETGVLVSKYRAIYEAI